MSRSGSQKRKRRAEAGAPAELHPATRRLLQGEVARLRPTPAPVSVPWWQRLNGFWPRIATASVIIIASFLTFRSTHDETSVEQLVRRDEVKLAPEADNASLAAYSVTQERREVSSAPAAPAFVPSPVTLELLQAKEQAAAPAPLRRKVEAAGALVGATQTDRPAMPAQKPALTDLSAVTQVAQQPAAVTANAEAESVAGNAGQARNLFTKRGVALTDAKEKKLAETTSAVLDNFAVEQVGDQLNFIDADGSTYTGALDFIAITETNVALQVGKAVQQSKDAPSGNLSPASVEAKQNAGSAYRFRAIGTNRTLRQPVIVDGFMEGIIVPASNVIANNLGDQVARPNIRNVTLQDAAKQSDAGYYFRVAGPQQPATTRNAPSRSLQVGFGANASQADAYKQQSQNWINASRIQGRVQVGGTNSPVQFFDAVPQTK